MATIFAGDESGSLGVEEAATRYLVPALVRFEDPDKTRSQIESFKSQHSFGARELTFHELSNKRQSQAIFDFLVKLDFRGWILIVDKQNLPVMLKITSNQGRYVYLVIEAITRIPLAQREQSILVLDEFDQSGQVLGEIRNGLKVSGIERGFKKIIAKRSSSGPLIQIADLIAGAAHRWKRYGENTLLNALKPNLEISEFLEKKPPS